MWIIDRRTRVSCRIQGSCMDPGFGLSWFMHCACLYLPGFSCGTVWKINSAQVYHTAMLGRRTPLEAAKQACCSRCAGTLRHTASSCQAWSQRLSHALGYCYSMAERRSCGAASRNVLPQALDHRGYQGSMVFLFCPRCSEHTAFTGSRKKGLGHACSLLLLRTDTPSETRYVIGQAAQHVASPFRWLVLGSVSRPRPCDAENLFQSQSVQRPESES